MAEIPEELIREEAYLISKVRERNDIPGTAEGDYQEALFKAENGILDDIFSERLKKALEEN